VVARQPVGEEADQVADLVGEPRDFLLGPGVGRARARRRPGAPAEGLRGARVAAGRPADPEVDPSGVERLQHPELLRHLERAVCEHDAARSHAMRRVRAATSAIRISGRARRARRGVMPASQ
jgi:hypothetical protein